MNSYDKVLNDMSAKELNELKEAFTEMNGSGVDMNDPHDRAARDFYRSLEKGERYTQRMSEEQAKSVVKALQKQGIEHSAVIGGKRSGVTVRQSDYPKAEKFFMTNDKLRKSAASIRSSKAEKDKDRSAERAAKGGISL